MMYEIKDSGIVIEKTFDLESTFLCGQCFRFDKGEDGKWRGAAFSKELTVFEKDGKIYFENVTEEEFKNIWVPFFDLEFDYDKVYYDFCNDEKMGEIMISCAKKPDECLHILRQEPWEALCSFIISQNNNIPRIKKIVNSLCVLFGEKIGDFYSFPSYEKLSELEPEDLAEIRSGFRARYIIDAARKVKSGEVFLYDTEKLTVDELRNMLMKITGVGVKVADCTMLYGLHRMDAFPIDTWMKKAMAKFFPDTEPESFGEYAGIAQQYIFSYSRMHPELFDQKILDFLKRKQYTKQAVQKDSQV